MGGPGKEDGRENRTRLVPGPAASVKSFRRRIPPAAYRAGRGRSGGPFDRGRLIRALHYPTVISTIASSPTAASRLRVPLKKRSTLPGTARFRILTVPLLSVLIDPRSLASTSDI